MKRSILVVLASLLLSALVFTQRENIPAVEASPDIYQGNLVLNGNNVTVIEGRFDINGNIIVEENATLILKNAVVNFTETDDWQFFMTLRNPANGNPHVHVTNTTITSTHKFSIKFYGNSSATIYDSQITASAGDYCWLWAYDSSIASFYNLTIRGVSAASMANVSVFDSTIGDLNTYDSCTVSVSNSTIYGIEDYGTSVHSLLKSAITYLFTYDFSQASVDNCEISLSHSEGSSVITASQSSYIDSLIGNNSSQLRISDSTINWFSVYEQTALWLVNSTYSHCATLDQSKVYVCWYLDVRVIDSVGQGVPSANVAAFYPNATVAEFRHTDVDGRARLTLMEKMMNATGTYPIGNYAVEATYETYSDSTSVNMTENKQITLQLPFIVPEFPSLFVLPLFMMATLLAIIVHIRKRFKHPIGPQHGVR
jgi:hypothetical protein